MKYECVKKNGKLVWNSYKPLSTPNSKTFPWWNSMLQVRSFNETPKTIQQVTYFPSPNVPDSEMQKFYAVFGDVVKYWSQFYVNPQPIIVTVITEKDHDWFINKWTELGKDDTGQGWWDRTGEGEGGGGEAGAGAVLAVG